MKAKGDILTVKNWKNRCGSGQYAGMESEADVIDVEEVSKYEKLVNAALDQRPLMQALFGDEDMQVLLINAFPQMTEQEQQRIWNNQRWKKLITERQSTYGVRAQNLIIELRERDAKKSGMHYEQAETDVADTLMMYFFLLQEKFWKLFRFGKKE